MPGGGRIGRPQSSSLARRYRFERLPWEPPVPPSRTGRDSPVPDRKASGSRRARCRSRARSAAGSCRSCPAGSRPIHSPNDPALPNGRCSPMPSPASPPADNPGNGSVARRRRTAAPAALSRRGGLGAGGPHASAALEPAGPGLGRLLCRQLRPRERRSAAAQRCPPGPRERLGRPAPPGPRPPAAPVPRRAEGIGSGPPAGGDRWRGPGGARRPPLGGQRRTAQRRTPGPAAGLRARHRPAGTGRSAAGGLAAGPRPGTRRQPGSGSPGPAAPAGAGRRSC